MKSWITKKSADATGQQADLAPQMGQQMAPQMTAPNAYPSPGAPQAIQNPPQIMPQVVGGQAYPTPRPGGGMPSPQMPIHQAPVHQAPMHQAPVHQAPAPQAPMPMQHAAAPMQAPVPQAGLMPQMQQAAQIPQAGYSHASPIPTPQPMGGNREEGELALPGISIHAFCERPDTAGAVQATTRDWRMARTNLKVYMGGLTGAVEFYHKETTPNLILIESGMRGAELFSQLESLASVCDEGTKVVVIGATNDIRLYRELMDKGVSDYLVPPFHPLTLIRSLSDLYVDPDKPFVGRVTAFFGAKGGVGSSTIAHNVAWALSTEHKQETSLIDLDSSWGTTGLDFNYDNVQGLEEALASPDRLDETLLDRIMIRHTETLSLLPAGASLNSAALENDEAYEAIIDGIRKISPLAILDLPHYWTKWTSQTLIGADDVVITATPDLANLRNTKNLIEFLRAERPNDADPILILNKTGVPKTPEIPVKDFASALGLDPALVLPYEPVLYTQASNDGKMLSDMKTDSRAVQGFVHIGHRLKTGSFELGNKASAQKSMGKGSSLMSKFKKKK